MPVVTCADALSNRPSIGTRQTPFRRDVPKINRFASRGEAHGSPNNFGFALRIRRCNSFRSRRCTSRKSLQSPMGKLLHDSGLVPILPLSLRLLPAEFLGRRPVSKPRQPLLSIPNAYAYSGIQPAMAQLLPGRTAVASGTPFPTGRLLMPSATARGFLKHPTS